MRILVLAFAWVRLGLAADVLWDSPSRDSSGSMPLGNGDIGINLWVEPSGDIVFYISKTDAWSENLRLLKLGRVRLRLSPNPLTPGARFGQELRTQTGEILVRLGKTTVLVWVDANQPVIRVEAAGSRRFAMRAELESWRTKERRLEGVETHSAYGLDNGPEPIVVTADTVRAEANHRLVWFHRNERSTWEGILRHQGLGPVVRRLTDPLLNRTFGGAIVQSPGSLPAHTASIHLLTAQTPSAAAWEQQLAEQMQRVNQTPIEKARQEHRLWWEKFWERSWIRVTGSPEAEAVTRGYRLQRFLNAAGGRGAYPIKFNGSIFTVDAREPGQNFDADYRRWGGPYWFQNTRLPYWSMLAAGDFDLMQPLFRMYADALELAALRSRYYFEHRGAFFPETMYFFGAYAPSNYGWDRQGRKPDYVENTYIRHDYNGGLELLAMMLDVQAYRPDRAFLKKTLIPLADEILTFYDEHFLLGGNGKIRMEPAQALETYQKVVNPAPDVAGLHYVLARLFWGMEEEMTKELRQQLRLLQSELPPIPVSEETERALLLPAEEVLEPPRNSENPELYAVFPFRVYGLGKPDLEMARNTFAARRIKDDRGGWRQDPIQAAYLGLAKQARDLVVRNFARKHAGSRFPGFYGPNFDWVPDQCHGSVQMVALQGMLVQSDYGRVQLFPAWPKDWNVEFRLHTERNTVVEGSYQSGKAVQWKVSPEPRRSDVTVHPVQ
ncbi:MAG: hypothetical protein JJE04_15970 [Acidobacteriia bacterium]|nr:hypothetical protein [Terriglobia bacterium]